MKIMTEAVFNATEAVKAAPKQASKNNDFANVLKQAVSQGETVDNPVKAEVVDESMTEPIAEKIVDEKAELVPEEKLVILPENADSDDDDDGDIPQIVQSFAVLTQNAGITQELAEITDNAAKEAPAEVQAVPQMVKPVEQAVIPLQAAEAKPQNEQIETVIAEIVPETTQEPVAGQPILTVEQKTEVKVEQMAVESENLPAEPAKPEVKNVEISQEPIVEKAQKPTETEKPVSIFRNLVKKDDEISEITVKPKENSGMAGLDTQPQAETIRVGEKEINVSPKEVVRQISREILATGAVNGKTSIKLTLVPEELGKITIELVSHAGRVSVKITAEQEATQNFLYSRGENLQEALKSGGVQLESYQVVNPQTERELFDYNGSAKNPYRQSKKQEETEQENDDFADIIAAM